MDINIIFPVLNERLRLEKGIRTTVEYLASIGFKDYRITVIDNGSTDETPQIAKRLCQEYGRVFYERISEKGVGAAFRRGVALNQCEIVGYMDIDLSADIKHLGEAIALFAQDETLQYVNGTRFSRASKTQGRKWYRKITSQGLLILLKLLFRMKCTDAICGFTFLRREAAEELVAVSGQENGWFYMIEFLLRAERRGMNILDYPVEWKEDYNTTVKLFQTIGNYLVQISRLFVTFYIKER